MMLNFSKALGDNLVSLRSDTCGCEAILSNSIQRAQFAEFVKYSIDTKLRVFRVQLSRLTRFSPYKHNLSQQPSH